MLNKCVGIIIVLLLQYGVPLFEDNYNFQDNLITKFENYIIDFDKNYSNSIEYVKRFEIFKKSLKEIEQLNTNRKSPKSAIYGLTQYSDMTNDEFLKLTGSNRIASHYEIKKPKSPFKIRQKRANYSKLPLKVDWRKTGFVSEVKSQRNCGACWAISVISVVESINFLKHNKTDDLSVQQMIDCSRHGNHGCQGGDMCNLLDWLMENDVAIQTERNYPLHLQNEECKMKENGNGVVIDQFICQSFVDNEEMILKLLAKHGPLAVSINAITWQNYVGGVIQFHCSGSLTYINHAVQLVGYDLSHEIPHYIVRNSWGKDFGEDGYLYIATGGNICGIANEVVALTVV